MIHIEAALGRWFLNRWHQRAEDSGVHTAAKQLRKQGVPVEVAVVLLAWRPA